MDTKGKKQQENTEDIEIVNITTSSVKTDNPSDPSLTEEEVQEAVNKMNPDDQTLDRG